MRDGAASETARRVAAHRLGCPREAVAYGRAADDDALGRDVALDVEIHEGRMHRYLCRRTAFFDRVVVRALDGGVRQVVLVGAGYDGRAMRFARPDVRFFEVDHPSTQRDKLARIERLGLSTTGITFVAADLTTDDVVARVRDAGLRTEVASLFVVEGLASYLTEDVLATTLSALRALAGAASLLAVSVGVSRTGPVGAARVAALRDAVAAMGEPMRNELSDDAFDALLAASSWRRGEGDAGDDGLLVAAPAPLPAA